MAEYNFGIIGDPGNTRNNGSRFYYNPGAPYSGNKNVGQTGPGQAAIASLIQAMGNTDLIALGDLAYITGASSLIDEANGRYYNNFMAPYPSPRFTTAPYRQETGNLVWPFDLYNHPIGYPNPVTGEIGGSEDGVNRFWPTPGNHDYGLRANYAETNISLDANNTIAPVGATSTAVPQPFIDYFGWLADPSLLKKQSNVKVQKADGTGQAGIYYSVELGQQDDGAPLIELFSLDTQRLTMNAGGYYKLSDGYGQNDTQAAPYNYAYDPTKPFVQGTNTAAVLTNDPANGQAQFEWLQSSLAKSKAKWKLLIGHQPVYTSGEWGRTQPDDHMSNPLLQRILNGLPEGSFDAYLNGHSHYYHRVLEGNDQGIGQGLPFITLGNSGRALYAINESRYGDNVYFPSTPGLSASTYNGADSPSGDIYPYLLKSDPTTTGVSAGYMTTDTGLYTGQRTGFSAGAYGYGFGAQDAKANIGYLFFNYKQTEVLDPAITDNLSQSTRNTLLIGWEGLNPSDWRPRLTQEMTSVQVLAATAQFSMTIGLGGSIEAVTVVNSGEGYMLSKGGNHIVDFEIRGNDSFSADQPNPHNYAIATLTFADGKLQNATLKHPGLGYTYLAQENQANRHGETKPVTTPQTDIVPINISLLESWYTVPYTDYHDWYLITDTQSTPLAQTGGTFGALDINIKPSTPEAQMLIATTPITTGYSGVGQQQKYATPQKGLVYVMDSLGNQVGVGEVSDGSTSITLSSRPAPGKTNLQFNGDPTSSYLINFKSSSSPVSLNYGNWAGPASKAPDGSSITLSTEQRLTLTRIDSEESTVDFGLTNGSQTISLLNNAQPASKDVLTINSIYSGNEWIQSEGQAFGSATSALVTQGTWKPTATRNGQPLALKNLIVNGNNVTASFADDITGAFTLSGTGTAINPSSINPVLTVQRLSSFNNALAFYEADMITGAITSSGDESIIPGEPGYLQAALVNAKTSGLLLKPSQLPKYQQSKTITDLPLNPAKNYGILLIVNNDESRLFSSYSSANPGGRSQFQSFGVNDRGLTIGIEDINVGQMSCDNDNNDLIVTIASSLITIV